MSNLLGDEVVEDTQPLREGLARCGFCRGSYSVELEIVCGECAASLCPFCATRSAGSYRCPDCRREHGRARC